MATMAYLASTVANATTGKEVRGAIAEAILQFDSVKGDVYGRLESVEDQSNQVSQKVDELDGKIKEVDQNANGRIDDLDKRKPDITKVKDRINHIVLGVDDEALEAVVLRILTEKGVI
ncbi:hypothetical protein IAL74_03665 [Limosilactobacillus fermentum]|uniref:hypothetical protein n=1 Tax=Limosilactobacillus fermentum TaxID=1613 RepID=UPI001882F7D9|nr:hypothetical protein [Limosilactobacillus fermentum]MBE8118028.1 hypothetical protein [Limosilactobacillus fermentum]